MAAPDDADDLQLSRWLAELRVDDAARSRARIGHRRALDAEETTLRGVVVGLAERGTPVVVEGRSGSRHRGRIRLVGADVVVLALDTGPHLAVRLGAVVTVRAAGPPVGGDRVAPSGATFGRVLAAVVEPGEPAHLSVAGRAVVGTTVAVGPDVVVVRLEGGDHAYVPVDAVDEATVPLG